MKQSYDWCYRLYLKLALKFTRPQRGSIYWTRHLVWNYKLPVTFKLIYKEETEDAVHYHCETYPVANGDLLWYGVGEFSTGNHLYTMSQNVTFSVPHCTDNWITFSTIKQPTCRNSLHTRV